MTLVFDEATTALFNRIYKGRDATRRRYANLDALDPRPGQFVVDLGCGNGMLLPELNAAMNGEGRIVGVDPSEDMLASAKLVNEGLTQVELAQADAYALPFEDGSVDAIVSVQVFEYIPDVPRALEECARVLKPAGRLVVGDMDFSTLSWASQDPERMQEMLEIWDKHFVDGLVPQKLPGLLHQAGFDAVRSEPLQFFDRSIKKDSLAAMMLVLLAAYAKQDGADTEMVDAWQAEQSKRDIRGEFYFSFTHVVTRAHLK